MTAALRTADTHLSTRPTTQPSDTPPGDTHHTQTHRTETHRTEAHPADADVHSWADPTTEAQRLVFWERAAGLLDWQTPWQTTHTWSPADPQAKRGPQISWFDGGRLNASVNCVDRHVAAGRGERIALHFEGEPGDRTDVTYADLQEKVNRAANALESLGIGPGDRVVIYLPVLVETIVITLACARIGAVHQLVFGGFSAEALRFRVEDTGAKLLVTTDGQYRRGKAVPVKSIADAAVAGENSIEHVLVLRRTGTAGSPTSEADSESASDPAEPISWVAEDLNGDGLGRDLWWHDVVDAASPDHTPEFFDAEHPLFIMYTSGTTGQPKGLVHTTGGYLTGTLFSYLRLFAHPDPAQREHDVHWCTADLAWVTAHTYEIYGPLAAGATQVIYEGVPNVPHPGRHFEIIDRHRVTSYYTAPTLVRSLMGWFPDGIPAEYDLGSIRLAGTVGEAVNPEVARWLRSQIGRDTHDDDGNFTLPLVDTWWQSESGSTVLSPRPETAGSTPGFKPGSVARPMPGWEVAVVDDSGHPTEPGVQGNIVITKSGPSMARTVWGNPERFYTSYWRHYAQQGWFLAGDGAQRDAEDDIWILGRIDDAINVSGHLLSTIEIESALISHPDVIEAGVAGVSDPKTGQAAVAFTVLSAAAAQRIADDPGTTNNAAEAQLSQTLRAHVGQVIGPVAKPRAVIAVPEVPKTRSGKIMRRLLAQIHDGEPLGDTTSLQNEPCVAQITQICRVRGTMRRGTMREVPTP